MQEIGHAALAIIPSFDGFQGNLERGTSKGMLAAGTAGGTQFGDAAGKSAGSRFAGHMKNAAKIAAVGLAAAGAVAIKFAGDSLEEAREAQKIGAQTAAVIKSTGGAARVTEKDIGKLTGRLSDMAGVDDEIIQNGTNVLLTFTKIRNEAGKGNKIFDQATKAALNMSTALGTDLKGASLQVGKALNDPVKGVTALARAGVQFTTQQKAQITALVEGGDANAAVATGLLESQKDFSTLLKANDGDIRKTVDTLTNHLTPAQKKTYEMYAEGGHTLDAQKRILKELDTQFAGSAKSQATEADKLQVAWGNLKEEVGNELIPVMDDLAVLLRKKGIPAARDFFGWVQDTGVPAVKDLYEQSKPALRVIKDLVGAFGDLPTSGKLATIAGTVAGGLTVKHVVGKIFERGGPANPMFVTVMNPGGLPGGTPGGPGGKPGLPGAPVVATGSKLLNFLTRAGVPGLGLGLGGMYMDRGVVDEKGDPAKVANKEQTEAYLKSIEFIDTNLDAARAKAAGLGDELDLVGSRKVTPRIKDDDIKAANKAIATFIGYQIAARRPVAPTINTSSIERAIALLDTMNAKIAANAQVERGVDNGVTYQHGGTGTNGRIPAGVVIDQRGSTIVAHDYDDFTTKLDKKARGAGLGGRP